MARPGTGSDLQSPALQLQNLLSFPSRVREEELPAVAGEVVPLLIY